MWLWRKKSVLFSLIFLQVFVGCGYSLSHRLKTVFDNPNGVFVPVFKNETEELGAEMVFTNALLRELKLHQKFNVAENKDTTPLALQGVVEQISYQPTALYAPAQGVNKLQPYSNIPDQINLVATVRLDLINKETKKVVWTQKASGSRIVGAYLGRTGDREAASGFGTYTQSLIDIRYNDVARDIMRDMYDSMAESL
jgi:hypothetical protein